MRRILGLSSRRLERLQQIPAPSRTARATAPASVAAIYQSCSTPEPSYRQSAWTYPSASDLAASEFRGPYLPAQAGLQTPGSNGFQGLYLQTLISKSSLSSHPPSTPAD